MAADRSGGVSSGGVIRLQISITDADPFFEEFRRIDSQRGSTARAQRAAAYMLMGYWAAQGLKTATFGIRVGEGAAFGVLKQEENVRPGTNASTQRKKGGRAETQLPPPGDYPDFDA
jgi:hypothetical protein